MNIDLNPQGSPEWLAIRAGKATASNFSRIVTGTGKRSSQWDAYIAELAADAVLGGSEEIPPTFAMRRGTELEPEARDWFASQHGPVAEVGFVTCKTLPGVGCSPDGLLEDGRDWVAGLEIKCPGRGKHASWLLAGTLPDEHWQQVHGCMAVTGLRKWHFVSYYPGLRPLHVVVNADDKTAALRRELEAFSTLYKQRFPALRDALTPQVETQLI